MQVSRSSDAFIMLTLGVTSTLTRGFVIFELLKPALIDEKSQVANTKYLKSVLNACIVTTILQCLLVASHLMKKSIGFADVAMYFPSIVVLVLLSFSLNKQIDQDQSLRKLYAIILLVDPIIPFLVHFLQKTPPPVEEYQNV